VKDLYKRLGIGSDAPVDEIRRAIAASADPIRREAEFILLSPRRRTVYDRNHRVLSTIGQLRGRLALGLRPFWSHGHHQDFTRPFVPGAKLDPLSVMDGVSGRWTGRGSRVKWLWWVLVLALIGISAWMMKRG
jgi:hypothetical protein